MWKKHKVFFGSSLLCLERACACVEIDGLLLRALRIWEEDGVMDGRTWIFLLACFASFLLCVSMSGFAATLSLILLLFTPREQGEKKKTPDPLLAHWKKKARLAFLHLAAFQLFHCCSCEAASF